MSSLCYSISNEHTYSFKNFTFQGIYNDLIRSGLSHTINLEIALPLSIHRCHYHLTLGLTQSHTASLHVVRTNRIKDCLVVEWRSKKHPRKWTSSSRIELRRHWQQTKLSFNTERTRLSKLPCRELQLSQSLLFSAYTRRHGGHVGVQNNSGKRLLGT